MVKTELLATDEDLRALANILTVKDERMKFRRLTFLVFSFISMGLVYIFARSGEYFGASFFAVYGIFCLVWSVYAMNRKAYKNTLRMNEREKKIKRFFIFSDDGIEIRSSAGKGLHPWKTFAAWGEYEHYLYVRGFKKQVVLVDKNKITDEEKADIIEYLKKYVKKKEGK